MATAILESSKMRVYEIGVLVPQGDGEPLECKIEIPLPEAMIGDFPVNAEYIQRVAITLLKNIGCKFWCRLSDKENKDQG